MPQGKGGSQEWRNKRKAPTLKKMLFYRYWLV